MGQLGGTGARGVGGGSPLQTHVNQFVLIETTQSPAAALQQIID